MTNKIEVVYTKAKLSKRMASYFIDVCLLFIFSVIFFGISNIIVRNSSMYRSMNERINEIRNDSSLYIDGVDIITYVNDDTKFKNYEEKKNFLSSKIDTFYHNDFFFDKEQKETNLKEYDERKLNAKVDGINLFVLDKGVIKENTVAPNNLYDFYVTEIQDHSYSFLLYNQEYSSLIKSGFWISIIQVIIVVTVGFIIFYLILPITCFKRGRQTIGMKIVKISLINVNSFNLSIKKYIFRFIFNLIICLYLNILSFLIPTLISLGMMFFSKTNSSLTNYIFNDYVVDCKDQDIYFNDIERFEKENSMKNISIENKNLNLK